MHLVGIKEVIGPVVIHYPKLVFFPERERDQVSGPYKPASEITFLYALVFLLLLCLEFSAAFI